MSPKFKILDKKNIYDGFFKMNEITLKYKKYNGDWSNEIKRSYLVVHKYLQSYHMTL